MPSLDELAEATGSQLSGVLQSAVETISSGQEISFRLYVRQVLPIDGFVYWVNAEIIAPQELARMNITAPLTATIKGSLHRQVVTEQSESLSRDVNNIIFTPIEKADDFNVEDPNAIYLGDDISDEQIISNSTPIWLALKPFATVYPSFLVPSNLRPPYIVADVRNTMPLAMASRYDAGRKQRYQFAQDSVRITLYGFSNQMALDYVDFVVNKALEDEEFGITNMPIPVDVKSNQVEINALAKKKIVDFEVNYYQQTTREISQKLIKEAIFNYEVI